MRIKNLYLENFRNYEKVDISFDDSSNINLFLGDNAQGKTNLLEAITVLSRAKSFRNPDHSGLIHWGREHSRIKATADKSQNELAMEFFVGTLPGRRLNKKNFKKNEVTVPVKDFIGEINVVLFHPEDLNMLYLSPSLRRKYLNTVLSQIDSAYFESLVNYNRLIKQRNKLLALISEGKAKLKELESWDVSLAENGLYIYMKRIEFVKFLNGKLSDYYKKISGDENKIKVKYQATIDLNSPDTEKPTADNYLMHLELAREADIRYRQTEKGIHRDDLQFYFDNHFIGDFASRGEMRTLLIALKLAEIEYIESIKNEKPILLLDDVFSELDKSRQKYLLKVISNYQSFVSATHIDFPLDNAQIFNINNGLVTK